MAKSCGFALAQLSAGWKTLVVRRPISYAGGGQRSSAEAPSRPPAGWLAARTMTNVRPRRRNVDMNEATRRVYDEQHSGEGVKESNQQLACRPAQFEFDSLRRAAELQLVAVVVVLSHSPSLSLSLSLSLARSPHAWRSLFKTNLPPRRLWSVQS